MVGDVDHNRCPRPPPPSRPYERASRSTTKAVGEGTGLGLDISWRIVVKKHHGDLSVVSEPGDTRFQVRLPLVAPVPEAESADIDPATLDLGATPK